MKFKTVNIKGKEYVTVNERIKFFRDEITYKGWSIDTEVIKLDLEKGNCCLKSVIKDEMGNLRASGIAYEVREDKSSFVNKTSFVENCETSSIGRALGILGIGIDTSIASADEVKNAINQQNNNKKPEQKPNTNGQKNTEYKNNLTFEQLYQVVPNQKLMKSKFAKKGRSSEEAHKICMDFYKSIGNNTEKFIKLLPNFEYVED